MDAEKNRQRREQFVPAEEAVKLMQGCSHNTLKIWRRRGLIVGKRIRGQRGGFHYQVGSIEDAVSANSIQGRRKWGRTTTQNGQRN
ncbi:hypothetical protein GCM10027594_01330 [Hymenobacter agri]